MFYDKLGSLVAEIEAMNLWDRGKEPVPDDEVEARRLRRLELIREIDALLELQIKALRHCCR